MKTFRQHEYDYVVWQNRATRFYLGARKLYQSDLWSPAAYCAAMTLELQQKATLIYWDRGFDPADAAHGMAKLARMIRNKVPNAKGHQIPEYFYFEQRYLSTTRYPRNGKGIGIPSTFLPDLDSVFARLIQMVPFQHNTELKSVLSGRNRKALDTFRRGNTNVKELRHFLEVHVR